MHSEKCMHERTRTFRRCHMNIIFIRDLSELRFSLRGLGVEKLSILIGILLSEHSDHTVINTS